MNKENCKDECCAWIKKHKIASILVLIFCIFLYDEGYLKVTNPSNPLFIRSLFSFHDYSINDKSNDLGDALSKLIKQGQRRTDVDKFFFETGDIDRATWVNKGKHKEDNILDVAYSISYIPNTTIFECILHIGSPDPCYYTSVIGFYSNEDYLLNIEVHGRLIFPTSYKLPPARAAKIVNGQWE